MGAERRLMPNRPCRSICATRWPLKKIEVCGLFSFCAASRYEAQGRINIQKGLAI
jgi:hypothetical protein